MKRIYLFITLITFSVITLAERRVDDSKLGLVKIIESNECVKIPSYNGGFISLPKYEMVSTNHVAGISSLEDKLDMSGDFSYESFRREIAKREEMDSLSERLGIAIMNDDYLDFYREVASWLGTRYRMGSMSRKAVDCSGFTNIIYNKIFNKEIPRVSTAIASVLTEELAVDKLLPGDLVFFTTRGRSRINHVGMYLGEGHFVHASIKGVKVSDLTDGYYKRTFRKAGRIG